MPNPSKVCIEFDMYMSVLSMWYTYEWGSFGKFPQSYKSGFKLDLFWTDGPFSRVQNNSATIIEYYSILWEWTTNPKYIELVLAVFLIFVYC